ncbi:uncharacterized protein LOC135398312 [Ornithodoros turicata]|uniref:uncharacterized protein LOC135398312 n=1 Tax=Ornithodoros turicata TaxID=34597 RepID=UPI003139DDCC
MRTGSKTILIHPDRQPIRCDCGRRPDHWLQYHPRKGSTPKVLWTEPGGRTENQLNDERSHSINGNTPDERSKNSLRVPMPSGALTDDRRHRPQVDDVYGSGSPVTTFFCVRVDISPAYQKKPLSPEGTNDREPSSMSNVIPST